jgi:hypothetical protein
MFEIHSMRKTTQPTALLRRVLVLIRMGRRRNSIGLIPPQNQFSAPLPDA